MVNSRMIGLALAVNPLARPQCLEKKRKAGRSVEVMSNDGIRRGIENKYVLRDMRGGENAPRGDRR